MTGFIPAGGEGKRMRPVTCSRPKVLADLCGKPLISYACKAIDSIPLTEKFIGGGRFSERIKSGAAEYAKGFGYTVCDDENGEISAVCALDTDDDILVYFGDIFAECDLSALAVSHRKNRSDMTCALMECTDIRDKNLAVTNGGEITSVIEKPSYYSCRTGLALCGIFIISGKALRDVIGENGGRIPQSAETELIPLFIKKKRRVFGLKCVSYALDINTVPNLLSAQRHILAKKKSEDDISVYTQNGAEISQPVIIGDGTVISSGVKISGGTVIGRNVFIGRNAKLNGAFVGDGCHIGERASISGGYVCRGAKIQSGASVFEEAAVGDNAVIGENAVIEPSVRIWNGRQIDAETLVANDVKYGTAKPIRIGEDGIWGDSGGTVTPQMCALTGSSVAAAAQIIRGKKRIAVGYRSGSASKALALAVMSGVSSAGAEVWDIGECTAEITAFAVRKAGLSAGIFADAGVTARLVLMSSDGLPLRRAEERMTEAGINLGEYPKAGFPHFGGFKRFSDISQLYRSEISALCPFTLNSISAAAASSDGSLLRLANEMLSPICGKSEKNIMFTLSADGHKASAYTEESGYVFHERLILIACMKAFSEGRKVALPCEFPRAADTLAERYGRKIYRYNCCSEDLSDSEARLAAAEFTEARDSIALMLSVLDYIGRNGLTLKQAVSQLPEFSAVTRFIPLDRSSAKLSGFTDTRSEPAEGIMLDDKNSRIFIRPVKTGKGLMMYVESMSMEAAEELCDIYSDKLMK